MNLQSDVTEPSKEKPSEPQWRAFERNIRDLSAQLAPDAAVEHDARTLGRLSDQDRQIDVLITGTIAAQTMRIAVECKFYKSRLGIGMIDEFVGKLLDVGVERGVLYALNGFTDGAHRRAAGASQPAIVLIDLKGNPPDWQPGLPEFRDGECPNENCYYGAIGWQEWQQETGAPLWAGICHNCGTWAVRCRECDELNGFFWDTLRCDSCEEWYELIWDRKGVDVEDVLASGPNHGDEALET